MQPWRRRGRRQINAEPRGVDDDRAHRTTGMGKQGQRHCRRSRCFPSLYAITPSIAPVKLRGYPQKTDSHLRGAPPCHAVEAILSRHGHSGAPNERQTRLGRGGQPYPTLAELRQALGVACGLTAVWRAFRRLELTRKNSPHLGTGAARMLSQAFQYILFQS